MRWNGLGVFLLKGISSTQRNYGICWKFFTSSQSASPLFRSCGTVHGEVQAWTRHVSSHQKDHYRLHNGTRWKFQTVHSRSHQCSRVAVSALLECLSSHHYDLRVEGTAGAVVHKVLSCTTTTASCPSGFFTVWMDSQSCTSSFRSDGFTDTREVRRSSFHLDGFSRTWRTSLMGSSHGESFFLVEVYLRWSFRGDGRYEDGDCWTGLRRPSRSPPPHFMRLQAIQNIVACDDHQGHRSTLWFYKFIP